MSKLINKLSRYFSEYLDSRIIFALDFLLSFFASVAILLLMWAVLPAGKIAATFAISWVISSMVATIVVMLLFKNYRAIIRHSSLRDLISFVWESLLKAGIMLLVVGLSAGFNFSLLVAIFGDFLLTMFLFISVRLLMIITYDHVKRRAKEFENVKPVLVYGTSDKSVAAITRFQNSYHYHIVGFLTKGKNSNLKVNELPVYSYMDFTELKRLVDNLGIRCILFPTENDVHEESEGLVPFCNRNNLKALIIPSIDEVVEGKRMKNKIREVKIEDLLGRQEIKIEMETIVANFKDKTVMVTGAAGSIGS